MLLCPKGSRESDEYGSMHDGMRCTRGVFLDKLNGRFTYILSFDLVGEEKQCVLL